jgi:hypothetical protein
MEEIDYLEKEGPKWEDNIKLDLNEIVYEDVNWIHLGQHRYYWHDIIFLSQVIQRQYLHGDCIVSGWAIEKKLMVLRVI